MILTRFIYNLTIAAYGLGIRLAALFSAKARQWTDGRKDWPALLRAARRAMGEGPLIWVHCASLGEFEQGRPLIEWLKEHHPNYKILLTFFSPSGYEIRKNYERADLVFYLPLDTSRNVRRFLEIVQPQLAIFVKYEFWMHYLRVLQQKKIPHILISAIFRGDHWFFKSYGAPFRRLLSGFDHLFVQEEASRQRLEGVGIDQVTVAGDTRIDRVLAIAGQDRRFPLIDAFAGESPVLVVGSSWPPDEALLAPFFNEQLPADWKVIIAPHEIKEEKIKTLEGSLQLPVVRFSQGDPEDMAGKRVLVIDNIGMLSALYGYGRLAYIGGGFGAGIHNTLEPIAFGLPVFFGPKYHKFTEAVSLVGAGGAFPVETTEEFQRLFAELQDEEQYDRAAQAARGYVEQNQGATQRIGEYLQGRFLGRKIIP